MNWEIIIPGITALIGGVIGTIGSPWIKWHLENKKENRKDRIHLISSFRILLETLNPKEEEFLNSSLYSKIRPYLSKELVSDLEDSSSLNIVIGAVRNSYTNRILEELCEIEDYWDIGLPKKKLRKKHSNNKMNIKVSSGIHD